MSLVKKTWSALTNGGAEESKLVAAFSEEGVQNIRRMSAKKVCAVPHVDSHVAIVTPRRKKVRIRQSHCRSVFSFPGRTVALCGRTLDFLVGWSNYLVGYWTIW